MKYGSEKTAEICGYISQGNSRTDARILADISESTFYEWMQRSEFSEAIKKAEVKCKSVHILNILEQGKKVWTASAWFLERKYPEEYALKKNDGNVPPEAAVRLAEQTLKLMREFNANGFPTASRV